MTKELIARKNIELLEEFHRYAIEHPEVWDLVPKDAQLILLPENEPELLRANQQIIEECKRALKNYVVFRLRIPERAAPTLVEAA